MLRELSLRNAQRQSREYSLYFVTLACTVSLMYAFNALIFSGSVKALPGIGVLPYMIVAASALIVLIMGWIIGYMTNYMLKRRSRELSIYLLSGIPNRSISALVFYENILIGALAFVLGLPVGVLLAQLLEAVLLHMFGMAYTLHLGFSLFAAGLTSLYFLAMLLYSIRKNGKWVRKVSLYDLLYYDRQTEKSLLQNGKSAIAVFFLSVLFCCVGIAFLYVQPLGDGYDVLTGMIFLILFPAGFYLSVPTVLAAQFGGRPSWKYSNNRLVTFRGFTAKIRSMSIVMGVLSILFMLSLTFMGTGTAVCVLADKNIEQSVFDIMILHKEELQDFSAYEDTLRRSFPIVASHAYGIYTNGMNTGAGNDFLPVRNRAIAEAGRFGYTSFAEYQSDTYMKQSDYIRLREMLALESVQLHPALCYVHCVPALKKDFQTLVMQNTSLSCAGYPFAGNGIFCEPFSQADTYGNGLDYVIVVPDQAVGQMEVLYSLYAAITETPLDARDLQRITESCEGLSQLKRNVGKSAPDGKNITSLVADVDYLSGKWVDKESLTQLYAMAICLFYLALILEITGAAILAAQILNDREKKWKQDRILRQLGMNERLIAQLNNRQLSLLFLLPLPPSLIIGCCFIGIAADKMQLSAFHLPVFPNHFWIARSLGISLFFFALLYGIYYVAAQISYGRRFRG